MKTILKTSFYFLIAFLSLSAVGQRILPQSWLGQNYIIASEINIGDQSILFGLSGSSEIVNGDYYWEPKFERAKIYFYPQQIKSINGNVLSLDSLSNILFRFDLWNNRLEVKSENGIKVASNEMVSHVLSANSEGEVRQFINPKEFNNKSTKTFFEVLGSKSRFTFLHSKEVLLQPANYNPALDTGNKEPMLIKKDHFHFWNTEVLISIDSKKEASAVLSSLNLDAKKYFKGSKNKLKNVTDYKKLAHFTLESMP